MISTPLIRPFTSNDKETVLELMRLNTPEYFDPEEEKDLEYYLDREIEHYFVLELENQIVGSGGYNLSKDKTVGIISWDLIHPEFQRKSFGNQLLKLRMDLLREIKTVQFISVSSSQFVYPFYKKNGFRLEEVVEDYWAEGYDLYRLECTI